MIATELKMNSNIFIPKKIKVGYNKREDTYTKKLAYVIYYDEKGKLRKETSWEGWRDKNIEPDEFDNEPMVGFVLNKNVGGYAYHWDARKAYIRIFDPRGFEFEITLPNLLYILENTSCIKGKGLEGQFVYGWDGKELVLVPVDAPEYKKMKEMTETLYKGDAIKPSELKVGFTYLTAKGERYVYMGRSPQYKYRSITKSWNHIDWFERELAEHPEAKRYKNSYYHEYRYSVSNGNRYWFFNLDKKWFDTWAGVSKKFYAVEGDTPHKDYALLYDYLNSRDEYSEIDFDRVYHEVIPYEDWYEEISKDLRLDEEPRYNNSHWYFSVVDGNKARIEVRRTKDKKISYTVDSDVKSYYSERSPSFVNDVKEIYNKYPATNVIDYLKNGYKSNSRWVYEYEE